MDDKEKKYMQEFLDYCYEFTKIYRAGIIPRLQYNIKIMFMNKQQLINFIIANGKNAYFEFTDKHPDKTNYYTKKYFDEMLYNQSKPHLHQIKLLLDKYLEVKKQDYPEIVCKEYLNLYGYILCTGYSTNGFFLEKLAQEGQIKLIFDD